MNIKPSIYLTSDTHFGHQKMVERGHRTQSHNEDIIATWNNVIGKDDVVLHLGDLTMTNKEKTQQWTKQLKGRKFLVRGNHDGGSDTWFSDLGFEVIPAAYQDFKDKYENRFNVLFTHEPVLDLGANWFNIHGHLHGDSHRNITTTDYHYDVGVDAHKFRPIKLSEILDTFKKQLTRSRSE